MAEQVAVVHPGTAAKPPHGVAKLSVDERVDHDSGVTAGARDRELEVGNGLGARVADLFELLVWELRLERLDQPSGRLARGVGDDVQLDRRMLRHGGIVADNVWLLCRTP
jgi:hypothetical protein